MNQGISVWRNDEPFLTEGGAVLPELELAYKTWGTLNENHDNVVLLCHALTGHAAADEWFPGIFREDGLVSTRKPFAICINVPGSCYGSSGPVSLNPTTGKPWKADFPVLTIRDMVRAQQLLLNALGVRGIELVLGASMGGMQAMEWAVMDHRVKRAAFIAVGKAHRAWQIGISECQRQAIYTDPNWKNGYYEPEKAPNQGLATARMIGMFTYRSAPSFDQRFGRARQQDKPELFAVESYLQYQGRKLVDRMDAVSYVRLTQAMDSHDIAVGRGFFDDILGNVKIPVLLVGIDSDILYPVSEQKELLSLMRNAHYEEIRSDHGHDAFLIEFDQLNSIFESFLSESGYLKT